MPGTRLVNGRELARFYELEPERCVTETLALLESKELRPSDFSIRDVAEATLGREWVDNLEPKRGRLVRPLLEAGVDAVSYGHFSNITGQILFTATKDAYESEDFVFTPLVPMKSSKIQDMEKIPGISRLGDESEVVGEGDAYPLLGVSEDYVETAAKVKRGCIVPVTKEAVFGDLTGLLLDRCKEGGYALGLGLEKRVIDALIDENGGAKSAALGGHRYHWRGTSYASFQTLTPWINVKTSNGLVDYTDVQNAWQLLMNMRDPFTGEPILVQPTHIIVTTGNLWTAQRILNAVQTRTDSNLAAGNTNYVTIDANKPIQENLPGLKIAYSRLLDDRAATDTDWWLGNPAKALVRMANWDLAQEEAPANSYEAFHRDIVFMHKSSLKDVVSVVEPRVLIENQA